ncbi:fumarylacetoacetate hydrolase family protein [Nitrospinaceae bacterium]|nr:fumarylacetoacetate hydrolase family protein [Nitrospinaceae bacterium]
MATDSIAVGERIIKPCRIFCIGKNYAEHIRELDDFDAKFQLKNEKQPVVFMKPVTSIVSLGKSIHVPTHGNILHHEVEVVVLLNGGGRNILINDALSYVAGVTLGLDITLRDVQIEVKKKGHPWELSKSFDHSSPLGLMRSYDESFDLFDIPFACFVNEEKRQEGNTKDMIFSIPQIISFLSTVWKLMPGDLIYTGTPSGIGVIKSRDEIVLNSPMLGRFAWSVL